MRLLLKSVLEGVHTGLGYLGVLALAGLGVRNRPALVSALGLAVLLGIGHFVRNRRSGVA